MNTNLDDFQNSGLIPEVVILEIGKAGELDNTMLVKSVLKVLYVLQKVPTMTAITFCVGGFDEDERALCEIPEARQFILQFVSLLNQAGVPITRFMEDAFELYKSCLAIEMGKKVIFDEKPLKANDLVEEYRAKVRQYTH